MGKLIGSRQGGLLSLREPESTITEPARIPLELNITFEEDLNGEDVHILKDDGHSMNTVSTDFLIRHRQAFESKLRETEFWILHLKTDTKECSKKSLEQTTLNIQGHSYCLNWDTDQAR